MRKNKAKTKCGPPGKQFVLVHFLKLRTFYRDFQLVVFLSLLCCILEESCRGAFVILEFLYSTAKYGVSLRKVARNSASCKSVIASGNATFQENLDLETTNLHKNHLLDL